MAAAKTNFTTHTGLAWDLYDTLHQSTTSEDTGTAVPPWLSVRCPYCSALNDNILLVDRKWSGGHTREWTDTPAPSQRERRKDDGIDGWRCEACGRAFTKDNLAAKKWKDEVAKFLEGGFKVP